MQFQNFEVGPVALTRELNHWDGVVLSKNLLEATAKSILRLLMATKPVNNTLNQSQKTRGLIP